MANGKNTPPKGVIIAVVAIILMIVFYFVISAVFPDLFNSMNTGETVPVRPE